MDQVGTIVLCIATVVAGVGAGVFLAFSSAVMPGLRRVDDRAFVAAFQAIDRAILGPLYLGGVFLGTLALTVAAALLHLGAEQRAELAWIIAAAALHVAVIGITGAVNVPSNDALRAAGDPAAIDVAAARAAFDERRWSRWNHVRGALSLATAAFLVVALAV